MRLLDRYLFRELFTPLAYCLGGFLILGICFTLFGDLEKIQESQLRLFDVVEYSAAIVPGFLATVLPITLLLALLYALTAHAHHNEITAMRAAGLSLKRICAPYLVVGVVASGALFVLNEWCVPRSTAWADRILNRYVAATSDPDAQARVKLFGFVNSRDHRIWKIGEYDIKNSEMVSPNVSWTSTNGLWRQLQAERAVYTNRAWTFFGVREFAEVAGTHSLVPALQTNTLTVPVFNETPAQIRSEIKMSNYQGLRKLRKADVSLADILDYLRLHPDLPRKDARRLLTDLHGRLAAPWTCLVVVLIAIPFGAASGRRNLFYGVAGSIFICFGYFVIQSISLALGSAPNGHLPAWLAAWLPNLIFGALGLGLAARGR